jgi:hypothetical protein
VFGIVSTLIAERVLDKLGEDRIANGGLAVLLLIGFFITALIKPDYRDDDDGNSSPFPLRVDYTCVLDVQFGCAANRLLQ